MNGLSFSFGWGTGQGPPASGATGPTERIQDPTLDTDTGTDYTPGFWIFGAGMAVNLTVSSPLDFILSSSILLGGSFSLTLTWGTNVNDSNTVVSLVNSVTLDEQQLYSGIPVSASQLLVDDTATAEFDRLRVVTTDVEGIRVNYASLTA